MLQAFTNPTSEFFDAYENNIEIVREKLFNQLDSISPSFGKEARNILNEKLKANQQKPLLGELFPWIITDIINGDIENTKDVSVGWLAIYLYTIFLDEHIDEPSPINPTKFITGSLLAKIGLFKISQITNNTAYQEYVEKVLSISAYNQNLDAIQQKTISSINKKVRYSEGKNYVLLCCAGALAAQNAQYGEFITQLSKSLLLTLQYLDDIADYSEDFKSGNITVLLNEAFKDNPRFQTLIQNHSNTELLEELIRTGALYRVTKKINSLLKESIHLITSNNINTGERAAINLVNTLYTYTSLFQDFLKNSYKGPEKISTKNRDAILDKTENYLKIIAQSS